MKLTVENVIFLAAGCRAANDAPDSQVIKVVGVRFHGRFNSAKIQEHQAAIVAVVSQLPREFHRDGGGGWTMLKACVRRDGVQWCDTQVIPDILACLAIAAGAAQWALPRELFDWSRLPGGLPYLLVGPSPAPLPGAHLLPAASTTIEDWLAK